MTDLDRRIKNLERWRPKEGWPVEAMSDEELLELISTETGIPVSELTEERLEELIKAEEAKGGKAQ